uniref:guanylate cyclase n=1 Tax=Syphacia muris TaxID=451379 RepID=A0A0N5AAT9_9BILA
YFYGSVYARNLFDTVLLYAYAVNKTIRELSLDAITNGTAVVKNAEGTFYVSTGQKIIQSVRKSYTNEAKSVWRNRDGVRPLSLPVCGYTGNLCHPPIWVEYQNLFITGIVIINLLVLAIVVVRKRQEKEMLNRKWRIDISDLQKFPDESIKNQISNISLRSKESHDTKMSGQQRFKSKNYVLFTYNEDIVVGRKYSSITMSERDRAELRMMVAIEAENINRFLGLAVDGISTYAIWKNCKRGSIRVRSINKFLLPDNHFFVLSLVEDIINGLCFIHKSSLGHHGHLTSKNCLLNASWQVVISEFGLKKYRLNCDYDKEDLLFTAPELLRTDPHKGNPDADIYSFAIIASEILTKKPAWNLEEKGQSDIELNTVFLHLVRDCWQEKASMRPDAETIKKLLSSMRRGKCKDLMEHVSLMMERQAAALEEEVQKRTNELVEEKKKSDEVLKRMLPPQVAECLKSGKAFEPDAYECATIFLSDVVSFTVLASKCTPLQVIDLLDKLYMTTDIVINKYDIFKVETIGDAYLCVSGVPERNGNQHVKEIADMALDIVKAIKEIRITHLPDERISLRIGIHSGPVVAGVVGAIMPRYCLFGDSMTVTEDLESSGKANCIHISSSTYNLLSQRNESYVMEKRGEILLKVCFKIVILIV